MSGSTATAFSYPTTTRIGIARSSFHSTSTATAAATATTLASRLASPMDEDFFLNQVETTVKKVLSRHEDDTHQAIDIDTNIDTNIDILSLPPLEREALGVARNLNERLQGLRRNNDCPRCWMQRAHCICERCPPVALPSFANANDNRDDDEGEGEDDNTNSACLNRIFLLVHHKEIALKVDTAKLILSSFPTHCRLVVGGIGPDYQDSMKELMEAVQHKNINNRCLVLFPDEAAKTWSEIQESSSKSVGGSSSGTLPQQSTATTTTTTTNNDNNQSGWDLIVLDGTWAQARKLHSRYIPETTQRVKLGPEALAHLAGGSGHQLRRHDIAWRQVATFEATRLFLQDMLGVTSIDDDALQQQLASYQEIANKAAQRELGPPRV